jgi:hypothetical protein
MFLLAFDLILNGLMVKPQKTTLTIRPVNDERKSFRCEFINNIAGHRHLHCALTQILNNFHRSDVF